MTETIRKKMMAVILALAMVMSFMPVMTLTASAADDEPITATETADFEENPEGAIELLGGQNYVEYDVAKKEITLKVVDFSTSARVAVKLPVEVRLVLQSGTVNHITSTYNGKDDTYGILCKRLTIYGEGSLEVTGGTSSEQSRSLPEN